VNHLGAHREGVAQHGYIFGSGGGGGGALEIHRLVQQGPVPSSAAGFTAQLRCICRAVGGAGAPRRPPQHGAFSAPYACTSQDDAKTSARGARGNPPT
jgi:hypothetical protein